MAQVIITKSFFKELKKRFGDSEAEKILDLLETLETNPKKGKYVGAIGSIVIKELKYKSYRFYYVTDRFKIKALSIENLKDLIIKVVRMSKKNDQQDVIDEIRRILKNLGREGF